MSGAGYTVSERSAAPPPHDSVDRGMKTSALVVGAAIMGVLAKWA
jgi:hypothetical protein